MKDIIVKAGREKSLLRHHPWIFSGALRDPADAIRPGATVRVVDTSGKVMALGAWSPQSQIRVRVWSWDPAVIVDRDFFAGRLRTAIEMRRCIISGQSNAYRLVNAESDGLPGLIVDKYDEFLVCQFLAAGADSWREEIIRQLQELLVPIGIYDRSDVEVREKEGLPLTSGPVAGSEPPGHVQVSQNGLKILVDVRKGHKTGLYLDQSDNGRMIERHAEGREVLNCFAYTGGFTLASLRGGAERVVNVESSAEALSLLEKNLGENNFDQGRTENHVGDAFTVLRKFRDSGRSFDMVILDPPKFVANASQVQRGSRGYKDINLLAFKLLRPGGILVTFSCSGHVSADLFQKIVADAALDAGREARIENFLSQSADHPVTLNFPEGRYLKGLVCSVS